MKYLFIFSILFSLPGQAKIYDAFMCYTQVNTVVLFGVLKTPATLRINYYSLEKNPQEVSLKVDKYSRYDNSIEATGSYNGKKIIEIKSKNGFGVANIDLTPFAGTEDVTFKNEDIRCYFGKFEQ